MADKAERGSSEHGATDGETNGTAPPRKRGVVNTLYPGTGVRNRTKNHCRKFWWCDLLVIAVIVLIIVLPVIYVAIPKKAQSDVDDSTLEVMSQEVTSPRPDGLHLKLVSKARSDSAFHPTLEGFRAGLAIPGQPPFLEVDVPEVKSESETDIVIEQTLNFANRDQFIAYNKLVLSSEQFDVSFSGKTKLHLKGLSAIDVDYDKLIHMKGLNSLKGLNITETHLDSTLPKPYNLRGNVFIPNPSVMVLEMGNLTLDLSIDGTPIGQSLLRDFVLRPGDNNVAMLANVDQGAVLNLVTSKYKNAVVPMGIVGNSSLVGDQHLEYYEAALKQNKLIVQLNLAPLFAELGLNFGGNSTKI